MFLCLACWGVAYKCSRLFFSYFLGAKVSAKVQVVFCLNDLKIVLAQSQESVMFHTVQLMRNLTRQEKQGKLPTVHQAGALLGTGTEFYYTKCQTLEVQIHNNDSFDSHAFFRFIGSSSLSGSLGAPAYAMDVDIIRASGCGPQMPHASQHKHFPSSQLSVVHWRKPKVLSFAKVHICICMTVVSFRSRSLKSQKPKSVIDGIAPKKAETQLCFDAVLNTFLWQAYAVMHQ